AHGRAAWRQVVQADVDRRAYDRRREDRAVVSCRGLAGRGAAAVGEVKPSSFFVRTVSKRRVRWRWIAKSQKKIGPCFGSGPGVALIPLFFRPLKARGSARRQGAVPGLLRASVRIAPDDGCTLRCTPRLAARQRGILAFMPLTVVGPGRVHSARRGCPST